MKLWRGAKLLLTRVLLRCWAGVLERRNKLTMAGSQTAAAKTAAGKAAAVAACCHMASWTAFECIDGRQAQRMESSARS